ncbi:cobalamin B12-binding domain-containing protein [Paenibacillus mucilaginosus]|nr:B12-binding domain-containing protein [Paenibacillus mucilaginosus]MCG7213820.1 B12-binding domain-containing protein [Paenibacillus mucilaginosus]WDM25829.1 B12-binding domain-containing protein [Paenibacillus mucilaginosus]
MNFHAELLAKTLLSGDFKASWSLIGSQREAGKNSLYIYTRLLTPAMRYIGDLWEQNSVSVADEHLASSVCDRLLTHYAAGREPLQSTAGKAMFLCMEQEMHFLGLKTISSYFQECGWHTRFYGPNLPLEYALIAASNWKPQVIGISVSMVYALPALSAYIEAFEALPHRPVVLLGGRLASRYRLQPHGSPSTVILPEMEDVQDWMSSYARAGGLLRSEKGLG